MPTTSLQGFPYPALVDPANGPVGFQNLAQALEDKTVYDCLSTARPPHRKGRIIYETDTNIIQVSDGAAWLLVWEKTPTAVGTVQRAYKTASQVVNNSTTAVLDTHLFFNAVANGVYAIDATLFWAQAGGGASAMDANIGLNVPSGAWTGGIIGPNVDIASGGTIGAGDWNITIGAAAATLQRGVANVGGTGTIHRLVATLTTGPTAGAVTLRWAQATAAAFDLTLLNRSSLRAERIA